MKKKLIIFGSSEISEIANFYFSNFSSYEISCFVIDEEFIKENYFCEKPILPFKNIEKKFLPSEYDFHVALSYKKLNRLKETKFLEVKKKGYKCVPPDIAIRTRFFYDEQKTGEWLRFATPMKSMIDSDNVPHLPKLGKALGKYFVETYWSYPGAVFHPHNEFVVMKNDI